MRAIDANVVLRYLLDDIPSLAARARRLIDSREDLALTAIALAEVAWTLNGPRYQRPRAQVALQLASFLARTNIIALGFDKRLMDAALLACAATLGAPDLGDALIAAEAAGAGIQEIYTYDRRFERTGLNPVTPP